jgi:hypothetical protein
MIGPRFQGYTSVSFGTPQKITVKGFKALASVEVDLSSLSVIVGANSSGKSSFLQSILMLCQSAVEVSPGYVNLNSEILQLGTAAEIINYDETGKSAGSMEIRMTFPMSIIERTRESGAAPKPKIELSITLSPEKVGANKLQSLSSTRLLIQKMRIVISYGNKTKPLTWTLNRVGGVVVADSPLYELIEGSGKRETRDYFVLHEPGSFSPTQISVGGVSLKKKNDWYEEILQ